MTGLYVVLALLVALGVAVVVSHNRFVRQRNLVEESWRQIDVELRRRHDLVPNLVQTVQAYAAHERSVLEAVTAARTRAAAPSGSVHEQAADEAALGASLRGLLAVAEAYPTLKSDAGFRQLADQLAETEDRIAAGRRFYNGNVRALNTRVDAFPSALVASLTHVTKAEYFEELDPAVRAPVQVDFTALQRGALPPQPDTPQPDTPQPGQLPS